MYYSLVSWIHPVSWIFLPPPLQCFVFYDGSSVHDFRIAVKVAVAGVESQAVG